MQRSKKIWAIIAVMLAVLTLGAKQADAQTLDSNGRCHDSSGKYAANSVCGKADSKSSTGTKTDSASKTDSKTENSKSSVSAKPNSGKIQAEDGSWVNSDFYSKSSTKSNEGKILAEDGTYVNADFYSRADKRPAPSKAISKTNTGNGYLVYAYQPSTGEMYCAFEKTNDEAYYRFHSTVDAGWFIVRGYWASAEAKNFGSDCQQT